MCFVIYIRLIIKRHLRFGSRIQGAQPQTLYSNLTSCGPYQGSKFGGLWYNTTFDLMKEFEVVFAELKVVWV